MACPPMAQYGLARPLECPSMEPARQETDERDEDASLIRRMLSLTPSERLDVLQQNVNSILELRETGRAKDRAQLPLLRRALKEQGEQ